MMDTEETDDEVIYDFPKVKKPIETFRVPNLPKLEIKNIKNLTSGRNIIIDENNSQQSEKKISGEKGLLNKTIDSNFR